MANTSTGLDKWRDYFRSANSDIFTVIEHAIAIAASDSPYDFKLKRDRIAETLFTCKITRCFVCDRVELSVPKRDCAEKNGDEDDDGKCKSGVVEAGGSKYAKDCDNDGDHKAVMEMNLNNRHVKDDSYVDAEALTDEIEEAAQFHKEVLMIKEIIDNGIEETDDVLFDSLRRLQLMHLSVETLKTTEIGKSVNALRKHGSKEIWDLARVLINSWKIMFDEWVNATAAIAGSEATIESVKTSAVEEDEGLPSPPLDEGAFFATPASMELSQFFDCMDDDGNPQNCGQLSTNRDNCRKQKLENFSPTTRRHLGFCDEPNASLNSMGKFMENQEPVFRKSAQKIKDERWPFRPNPPNNDDGIVKPQPAVQMKVKNDIAVQKVSDQGTTRKKPNRNQQEEFKRNSDALLRTKLEAAKRKLHERYQEAETAKKQRTIQVVELCDLPKKSLAQSKPGSEHRQRANARR